MTEKPDAPTTQTCLEQMQKAWQEGSATLFEMRDGRRYKRSNAPDGLGHDLKNNEALRTTMNTIAERYIPWCAQKLELTLQARKILNDPQITDKVAACRPFEAKLASLNATLIGINEDAINTLKAEGSGLDAEVARQAEDRGEDAESIKGMIATEVLGSIINVILEPYYRAIPVQERNFGFVPIATKRY